MTSWGNFSHPMYKTSWCLRCSPFRYKWVRRGSRHGLPARWKQMSGCRQFVQLHWTAKGCPSTQNWIFSSSPSRHVSAAPLSLFIASGFNPDIKRDDHCRSSPSPFLGTSYFVTLYLVSSFLHALIFLYCLRGNRSRGLGAVRGLSIGRGCADCPPCFTWRHTCGYRHK